MEAQLAEAPLEEHRDGGKRQQIMAGAREVFLAQGFDAASMGEIARAAGVSKGTLYVYFESKERLFEAIVQEENAEQTRQIFAVDSSDLDVEAVLTRLGRAFVRFMCSPAKISSSRTLIGISERMPEIGRSFYLAGPARGVGDIARYLEAMVASEVLEVEDCKVAAAQFLNSCMANIFTPLLFNVGEEPSDDQIDHVVGIAVRTLLAAYRRR